MKNYSIKSVLYTLALMFIFSACSKDYDPRSEYVNRKFVRINKTTVSIQTGENTLITASYDSDETASQEFAWSVLDTTIASIAKNDDGSATVTGIAPGTTTIEIESKDGKLRYFSTLNVLAVFQLTNPIFIDFGPVASDPPFNVFDNNAEGGKIASLKDKAGNDTGYSITVTTGFNWLDRRPWLPNDFGFPEEVSGDMFFNDGISVPSAGFIVGNLKKAQHYTFYIYGAINDVNTETMYTVTGGNKEETVYLVNDYNTSRMAVVKDVAPNDNAQIIITMGFGPDNTQWAHFYGINAMIIGPEGYVFP